MRANPAGTIAVGLLLAAFGTSRPATAEIVYTPVNTTITGNGSIQINLDHNQTADFALYSSSQLTSCGLRGALAGSTTAKVRAGDGVVVSHLNFAAVLASGTTVDINSTFHKGPVIVTRFFLCEFTHQHVAGYLGLEFQINGQTHYGWAQVIIDASFGTRTGSMTTTLVDFAYETVPGQGIKTGQTSENSDDTPGQEPVNW